MAPFDIGPAGRMAVFADPQGAEFCVWQAGADRRVRGGERVSARWCSTPCTRRTCRRRWSSTATVFGWAMEAEGEQSWMIRLPGYSEEQDKLSPGFTKGMEEMGAPEGFADVVAAVAHDGPARWEVTFAVESADDAAARVRELGGRVVSEPQDLPWVRETTVKDPDGAPFVLSQFVPPEG